MLDQIVYTLRVKNVMESSVMIFPINNYAMGTDISKTFVRQGDVVFGCDRIVYTLRVKNRM